MRRFIISLFLSLFALHSVASTVPVTNMQNAISGVTQSKMTNRGFATNDPRFSGTLVNMGTALAGAATGAALVTAAGITAPAWVTTGIAVGLGTVITYAFNLAVDSAYKWIFNSDGTVTSQGAVSSGDGSTDPHYAYTAMVAGGAYYMHSYNGQTWKCGSGYSCAMSYATAHYGADLASVTWVGEDATSAGFNIRIKSYPSGVYEGLGLQRFSSGAPASCAAGTNYTNGACTAAPGYVAPNANVSSVSVASAIGNIPSGDLTKPLNPAVVATLANQAWQQAASQPGYSGLPYDAANPITAADAAAWQSANASAWPTVGNFTAPQPAPSGGTAATPFTLPTSTSPVVTADPNAATSSAVNPATGAQVNLGSDPGIGAPTLESTPTAQMILAPVLNLFPTLKNFVVPAHSAECPKPSMMLFSKSLVLDGHCTLLETVRPTLYAVMAFVWVVIALFIVLAA